MVAGGALVTRWQAARHFAGEPRYSVVRRIGPTIELRRYDPMVVAETRVAGSLDAASNAGFRRIAGYIFGGNRQRESIAMTTPVAVESERLAMTTPVTIVSDGGERVVTFVMPPGRTLASLPVPNDALVTLRDVPARTLAVLTYSGTTSDEIVAQRTSELRAALEREGVTPIGASVSSRYDPPTTIPVLRRNEIWLPIGA